MSETTQEFNFPSLLFFSVITRLLHKAEEKMRKEGEHQLGEVVANRLEINIERLLADDKEIREEVRRLAMELRGTTIEHDVVLKWRGLVRPIITLGLSVVFIILLTIWITHPWLIEAFGDPQNEGEPFTKTLADVTYVFLGIYGSIIGFWFGSHTAEKPVISRPS